MCLQLSLRSPSICVWSSAHFHVGLRDEHYLSQADTELPPFPEHYKLHVIGKLTRFVSTFDGICATECYLLCSSKGTGTKAAVKELEKIDALFVQYVDKMEDNCIG